jgi:hypothetical protein
VGEELRVRGVKQIEKVTAFSVKMYSKPKTSNYSGE